MVRLWQVGCGVQGSLTWTSSGRRRERERQRETERGKEKSMRCFPAETVSRSCARHYWKFLGEQCAPLRISENLSRKLNRPETLWAEIRLVVWFPRARSMFNVTSPFAVVCCSCLTILGLRTDERARNWCQTVKKRNRIATAGNGILLNSFVSRDQQN